MESQSLSQTGGENAIQVRDETAQSRRADKVPRQLGPEEEQTLVQSPLAVTLGLSWKHAEQGTVPGLVDGPR